MLAGQRYASLPRTANRRSKFLSFAALVALRLGLEARACRGDLSGRREHVLT